MSSRATKLCMAYMISWLTINFILSLLSLGVAMTALIWTADVSTVVGEELRNITIGFVIISLVSLLTVLMGLVAVKLYSINCLAAFCLTSLALAACYLVIAVFVLLNKEKLLSEAIDRVELVLGNVSISLDEKFDCDFNSSKIDKNMTEECERQVELWLGSSIWVLAALSIQQALLEIAITAAGGWFFSFIRLNNLSPKPLPNYFSMRRLKHTKHLNYIKAIQDRRVAQQKRYHTKMNPTNHRRVHNSNHGPSNIHLSSYHSCECGHGCAKTLHPNVPLNHCPCVYDALNDPKFQLHIQHALLSHHHSHECQCNNPHRVPEDLDHSYL